VIGIAVVGVLAALAVAPVAETGEVLLRGHRTGWRSGQVCVCSPTGATGAGLVFGAIPERWRRHAATVTGPLVIEGQAAAYIGDRLVGLSNVVRIRVEQRPVTYELGAEPVLVPLGDLRPGEGTGVAVEVWAWR
jgi:hypothetical protein